jgi:hypothetical protein
MRPFIDIRCTLHLFEKRKISFSYKKIRLKFIGT